MLRDLELKEATDHYTYLAKLPGWKQYVWQQINDMATENPDLYAELPNLVTERVRNESHPPVAGQEAQPQRQSALGTKKQGG